MTLLKKINLQLFADNTNATTDSALSAENKTFYDQTLLRNAEPELVHDQFGQKRPIPAGKGKTIEFRKYSQLPKAMTPLTEGVTPDGQKLSVTSIDATVQQYGGYVSISDVLDLTAIDNNIVEAATLLGSQAGRTLDSVTRSVINGGTSVAYAPKVSGATETAVTSRKDLDSTSALTTKEIFKIVNILKRNNIKPVDGTNYVCIIHPDVELDIMNSVDWKDIQKYSNPQNIYKGEIGMIGNCRFVVSSEAQIFAPEELVSGVRKMTVKTAISSSSTSVVVNGEYASASSINVPCYINGVANTITAIEKNTGYSTLTVGTAITSLSVGDVVCGKEATKDGLSVYSCLFIGSGAYGVTEVEGGGLKTIIKQSGSGGTSDPLDQRATVGWKALKTARILNDLAMVRFECTTTNSGLLTAN